MSVNLRACTETKWQGAGGICRWCNLEPLRGGNIGWRKKFCSKTCFKAYAVNHVYRSATEVILTWNRTCDCKALSPQGAYLAGDPPTIRYFVSPPPHVVCAGCGQCEEQLAKRNDKITINHINPRNGIPMEQADCIHHLDNLEPLCWWCHAMLNKLGNNRSALTAWLAKYLPYGWPLEEE